MTANIKRLSGKYVFQLSEIDPEQVCTKFGLMSLDERKSVKADKIPPPTNTTPLVDLNKDSTQQNVFSFLDESKKPHRCNVFFIDFKSQADVSLLNSRCFWCRHTFDTQPIGCPVRFVPSRVQRDYVSAVNKEKYSIKENVSRGALTRLCNQISASKDTKDLSVDSEAYYITDGVFCSFNCCQAYISENKKVALYDHSSVLLSRIYNTLSSEKNVKITPAPSWRVLEDYGGTMNIERFRESFNRVDFIPHGTCDNTVYKPIGHVVEHKLKF